METFITIKQLADMVGVTRSNILKRVRRDKVATIKSPVMTKSGPKVALLVPEEYAEKVVALYETAKINSKERD